MSVEKVTLDSMRHYAAIYFHGHSVGGTNPSLLEAMACESFIAAHDNIFNRSVLKGAALYFKDASEITALLENLEVRRAEKAGTFRVENLERLQRVYNWDHIVSQHEALFQKLLTTK